MCGIAGIYNGNPDYRIDHMVLMRMTRILAHRGPDDEGFHIGEGIGLGHRRLSIIDLSGGKQPIHNEDSSVWVIFNGEIFNYLELMDFLIAKGHKFYTRCDTEVLVHLYEEYGERFVEHLNGQFAIALWDKNKRELILTRDRVGIRPLYYTQLPDKTVLFGSEIKALFRHPDVHPAFDSTGIEQVFTIWTTIPPRTVFANINELRPGGLMKFGRTGSTLRNYWRLSFPDRNSYDSHPFPWYTSRLRELLHDAVELRLRADVPVAAYLSGGLDSSIIAALVKKHHNNNLITFSVSFKDDAYDERGYQKTMVDFLGTDHRTIEVGYQEIGELFKDVLWHAEYPTIRTAPAPLFALSALVRRNNIKVVLTGEGADEIFGGYNIFKENRVRRFWARDPDSRLRPLLLARLYPYIKNEKGTTKFWELFFKNKLLDITNPYYSHLLRWSNTSRIKKFFTPDYRTQFNENDNVFEALDSYLDRDIGRWDPLCQAQYLETMLFMPGYLLSSQGDRMMMGNSVEGRFPFLDYRVIEFAAGIPPQFKLNTLNEKYILKQAFSDLIPASIVNRPKQPYRAPIGQCFLKEFKNFTRTILEEDKLKEAKMFDPQSVELLLNKISSPDQHLSESDDMAVSAIASTQLLHHHFIGQLSAEAPLPQADGFRNTAVRSLRDNPDQSGLQKDGVAV